MGTKFLKACTYGICHWFAILEGCLWTVAACWVALALSSFNSADSSLFTYHSTGVVITNKAGFLGAQGAAVLIYFLGTAAWLVVALFFFVAWTKFLIIPWRKSWDRYGALALLIFSVAGLSTRFGWAYFGTWYTGGLLGRGLYALMIYLVAEPGATVVLCALVLGSFIIAARTLVWHTMLLSCRGCVWLYQHHAWRPVVTLLRCSIAPFNYGVRYLCRIFNGYYIRAWQGWLTDFEQQDFVDEQTKTITEHIFWHDYLTTLANTHDQSSQDVQESQENLYQLPTLALLKPIRQNSVDKEQAGELEHKARLLEDKLRHFGIEGHVVAIKRGPVVTLFEYKPDIDARISKIIALEDDLALALQAMSIRIIAPIPGTAVVGFEVANATRQMVSFAEIAQSATFAQSSAAVPLILGSDTVGNSVIIDLAKTPHLLLAGSTGSGKSVALHAMLASLLFKKSPQELKLILIDPKRLEFAAYADIAHLLFPIVMQPQGAITVLKWVVHEMEERYRSMSQVGARNVQDYNLLCAQHPDYVSLPFVVVVIDELADLMMTCGKDIEDLIARIAQMARAAGIHMIVATQRPSVDVITGIVKVNFPSRVSCRVTSKIDSRTILDSNGAEKLLGRGDMLFLDAADSRIKRVHGAYIADTDINALVGYIRAQCCVEYVPLQEGAQEPINSCDDQLMKDILAFLSGVDEVSISLLQRKFKIGFNRSARIMDALESQGHIAPSTGAKMRKVIHQNTRL